MKRLLLTMALSFALISTTSADPALKPDHVLQLIHRSTPKAVAAKLKRDSKMDQLFTLIDTGDRKWLEVAKALWPGLVGEADRDMHWSVGTALVKNPKAVLEIFSPDEVEAACEGDFIEPDEEFFAAFLKVPEQLALIKEPVLAEKKRLCIAKITTLRDRVNELKKEEAAALDAVKREPPDRAFDKLKELRFDDKALTRIFEGNRDWMAILPLVDGSLARRDESRAWVDSMRFGLIENPAPFLEYMSKGPVFLNTQNVCAEPSDTRLAVIDEHIAKLKAAFARLKAERPELVPTMDACLKQMTEKH